MYGRCGAQFDKPLWMLPAFGKGLPGGFMARLNAPNFLQIELNT
jgi:hypothetical protein